MVSCEIAQSMALSTTLIPSFGKMNGCSRFASESRTGGDTGSVPSFAFAVVGLAPGDEQFWKQTWKRRTTPPCALRYATQPSRFRGLVETVKCLRE